MSRQVLTSICFLVLLAVQSNAQGKWVSFLKQEKTPPSVNLLSSSNSNVSFTVQINGMTKAEKKVEYTTYQRLTIPDAIEMTDEGLPRLPFITKLIAIPDCDDVTISVIPSNKIKLNGYNVLPVPSYEKKKSPDGSYIFKEIYDEDFSVYTKDVTFPGKFGEILETGYIRDQKVARVAIYPLQFNSAKKELEVYTNFNIDLSFVNPTSEVNKDLGIFRNMMYHTALNYSLNGINASTKNVNNALGKNLSKVTSGSVTRVTNLNDLVGSNAIPVDYLIITHPNLFNSSSLTTLANQRRDYNGYDVAIIQVNSDLYNRYSGPNYQDIRDYIKDVFQLGKANHTGDGHLAYICLVGDANFDNTTVMLPAATPPSAYYSDLEQGGDYYYACTDGDTDPYMDVMYGRLSVGNTTELQNIVDKITYYENSSSGSWRDNIAFMSFSHELFKDYSDPAITAMAQIIPSSKYISYAWRGYAVDTAQAWGRSGFENHSVNDVSNAGGWVDEMWFRRYTGWIWCEWVSSICCLFDPLYSGGQYHTSSENCSALEINSWLYSKLNAGQHTFVYEGHGGPPCLGAGEGAGRYIFKVDELASNLNNTGKYPFIIAAACGTGRFDKTTSDLGSIDCLAEVVVNMQGKGAIGYLGSTRDSDAFSFNYVDKYIIEAQHKNLSFVMGEAVMESKINPGLDPQYRKQFNLYGDPALNLWPTDYTISQNITLSGDVEFAGNLTVASGVTLTISPGTYLHFANGASLIVNSSGTLTANGNSSNPITFDFVSSNSSKQNGIKFNSGSTGTINYCQIRNAYRGIYENSVSVNITNSAISGCTDGVYLYSSTPLIQGCNIHNNSNYGINMMYSSSIIKENYIQNNGTGIFCSSSSHPVIGNNSTHVGNDISSNVYGVIVFNNANPVIGNTSSGGYNNLVNTTYNVLNTTGNTVYAYNNWWGTTNPAYFKTTVLYANYLTSSVGITPTPPLNKSSGNSYASENSEIPMLSELNKAYELVALNNLAEAREICLNLINNYPDYSVSYNALNLLKETYVENELTAKKDIYKSLFNKKSKKNLYAMAGLMLSYLDKENKLKQIDEVINTYKGESVVELALFDKFVYYYFEKENEVKAREISKELDVQFPLSQGAIEAHKILGDEEYYGIDPKKETQKTNEQSLDYSLSENYPNPFNPTTRIAFTLPQKDNVKLVVYDILGREIVRLADGIFEVGKHEFDFNATNLPSGVYFYNIQTSKGSISKKMILLK